MPIPLSAETLRRVDALFEVADRMAAAELLITDCADNLPLWVDATPSGLERVRFAVLKLSSGEIQKLRDAVRLAQVDWRDVLVAAGFARDPMAHQAWFPG